MAPSGAAPGGVAPGAGVAGSCAPGSIHVAHARARPLLGSSVDRPTAVFAASDEMAIGTILAARDFGLRVSYDLSVTGIDGHELGEVFGLTTIDQDARGQGALAVRRLLDGLDGVGPLGRPTPSIRPAS